MKVLVIDDKESELEKAVEVVKEKQYECITCNPTVDYGKDWMSLVSQVDGVVTDLMWPPHSSYTQKEKPIGLLVVIHCLFVGKPVVICTNAGNYSGYHHGKEVGFIFDGYISSFSWRERTFRLDEEKRKIPFGWEEKKDWGRALDFLFAISERERKAL